APPVAGAIPQGYLFHLDMGRPAIVADKSEKTSDFAKAETDAVAGGLGALRLNLPTAIRAFLAHVLHGVPRPAAGFDNRSQSGPGATAGNNCDVVDLYVLG